MKIRRSGKVSRSRCTRLGKTYESVALEQRLLLAAVVAAPDPIIYNTSVTGPIAPNPGHTFYVSGLNSQGTALSQWANASAITPYTTNDLVMNVSPFATNYVGAFEAAGGTLGAAVLTNGITQTQTAPLANPSQPAVGDGGASDQSNNANVVASAAGPLPYFTYNLGTAGGAAPSATGYDLTEIDLISGHQDQNGEIFSVDVLVEPVGSNQFLSLSSSQGLSLTKVPDGQGGSVYIGKGSSQLAIVSDTPNQPMARNIQAVKLIVMDSTSFLRELVVTGSPSTSLPSTAPTAPAGVVANTSPAGSTVSWTPSSNAVGYTVWRATAISGPYASVGSVVGQNSFADPTAQPNSTYYYEVTASGKGESSFSSPSSPATTTNFGATAYLFGSQLWQGSPAVVEHLPQLNFRGGTQASSFPLYQGFSANSFSVFVDGKITTDLAGSYTFVVNADDDGYLWVNGQLVSASPGAQQNPSTTIPITLAAHTSYDFVFLENQRGGQWGFSLSWQEPQGDGTPGPLALVPASHLSSTVDPAPVPSQPAAMVTSTNGVTVNWNAAGDTSSYGYVIERAWSDSGGNPTTPFSVVGQVFSGPATVGAPGAATWGATSFVDTTALANTSYVYKVGVLMPGQSAPASLSPATPPVALPPVDTVSLSNGVLSITAGDANDAIGIYLDNGNQIVVTEGATTGDISAITILSTPASSVNSLFVSGISGGYQSLNLTRALSFSGSVTATQLNDIWVYGALSASQVSLVASGNIGIYASITTTGPVMLQADSNNDGAGTLSVASAATVSSGGSPVSVHSAGLALSGTINAGGGNITYSLWPLTSVSGLFSNTVSSGTVTIAQTTSSPVALSGVFASGVSGKVILDYSTAAFSTTGLDTTGGNAALQIVASSIFTSGPINTGNSALTLSAGNVTLGASVNAGSLSIPSYAHVTVNGATVSVAGGIANAGSLLVGTGGTVTAGGALSGNGIVTAGLPSGSGTVAYYRFEGTPGTAATGAASITDASGNGLSGTPIGSPVFGSSIPTNPVPLTGQTNATALSFNGADQRVFIPDSQPFQLTRSLTLEAWIYALPLTAGNIVGEIIFRGDARSGYDPYFLEFGRRGPNIAGFTVSDAANNMAEVDAAIPLNQWTHVAGTLDDATGQLCLYVNGALASSKTTTIRSFANLTSASPGLGIGGLENGGEYFNGLIDEVRISNVALTPSQFLSAPARANTSSLTAASISQSAVTVNASGIVTVRHNSSPSTSTTNSLNITPGGKFDLSNNALIINYAGQSDPATTIRSYLAAGYNGGAWNGGSGAAIISTAAAADPNHNTGIGWADSADGSGVNTTPNTVELKYTLNGDTTLNGTVDIFDLNNLLAHYNKTGDWTGGDSTYNGTVDIFDLNNLLANYNKSLGSQVQSAVTSASATSVTRAVAASTSTTTASDPENYTPLSPQDAASGGDDLRAKKSKRDKDRRGH